MGILKKIRKYVTEKQYKTVLNGIFTSKLLYCITTWGAVWGLEDMDDDTRNQTATTKEDMRKLQVLQNKAIRLHKMQPRDTPTKIILDQSKEMSVHQLVAYHSAIQVYKTHRTWEPIYHYNRLFGHNSTDNHTRSTTKQESRT